MLMGDELKWLLKEEGGCILENQAAKQYSKNSNLYK